jgi:hypothetical protein
VGLIIFHIIFPTIKLNVGNIQEYGMDMNDVILAGEETAK